MKKEFLALAAMLLSGAGLAAQSGNQGGLGVAQMGSMDGKTQPALPVLTAASCPVSIEAKHLADGSTVRTSGVHPVGVGQWLSLTLISVAGEKRQVVKATLMVHGIKPSGHVTETLSGANGPDNIVKALTVPFRTDEQQNALANLWVPGVSAVDRIDLVSLDYSDGSTWIAGAQNCHVVPDPKMLIVNR